MNRSRFEHHAVFLVQIIDGTVVVKATDTED